MNQDAIGYKTLRHLAQAPTFNDWMVSQFDSHLVEPILEIGAGNGNLTEKLLARNLKVTATDVSDEHLRTLQEKFARHKQLITIDFYDLESTEGQTSNKYNTILLTNVLEHTKNPTQALSRLAENLNKNGKIIILVPANNWLYCKLDVNLGHYKRYTSRTLSQELNLSGFNIEEIKHFNAIGILGWFIWGKLLGASELQLPLIKIYERLMPLNKLVDKLLMKKLGLSLIAIASKK